MKRVLKDGVGCRVAPGRVWAAERLVVLAEELLGMAFSGTERATLVVQEMRGLARSYDLVPREWWDVMVPMLGDVSGLPSGYGEWEYEFVRRREACVLAIATAYLVAGRCVVEQGRDKSRKQEPARARVLPVRLRRVP